MDTVTKPVTLEVDSLTKPVKDPWGNERMGAVAKTTINRKDFGLGWNVPLDAGGFVIGDVVEFTLSVQALAQ